VAVLTTMLSFYRANQEERVARLQEQLPGQELVSVEIPPDEDFVPAGKGARSA
jgi:hypothetical protein